MNDFKMLWVMCKRNVKLYFKDKGTFFTSLITPLILLVLFLFCFFRSGFLPYNPQRSRYKK